MIHLRSLTLPSGNRGTGFPFNVPTISTLPELAFETPVTFFVGENGSGKSVRWAAYEELEHVKLTREFLADPERFLRRL